VSSISVVVPTIGRTSLKRTLQSIVPQLDLGDEVVIVGDGPCKHRKGMIESFGVKVRYMELPRKANDWGGTPRNMGMRNALGNYIAFMDDDDVFLPGAFKAMHETINHYTGRAFLFKMMRMGKVIWERPELVIGNVSTQMILMPNRPTTNPVWEGFYEADFKFISDLVAQQPYYAPIMWMDDVIAELKEHAREAE
jgi:glycosyltransferase involved in cell wall biosynthesis